MATSFIINAGIFKEVSAWCYTTLGRCDSASDSSRFNYWPTSAKNTWRIIIWDIDDAVIFKLQWHDQIIESIPYD